MKTKSVMLIRNEAIWMISNIEVEASLSEWGYPLAVRINDANYLK